MPARDVLEPNNLRPVFSAIDVTRGVLADLREDLSFARALWRAFGPAPRDDHPVIDRPVFPVRRPLAVPSLAGRRVAIVASGGSGATAALVGVRRAFEEAGIEPVAISACSGSVLFASLWASGWSSDQIASFWLGIPVRDYIDPSWRDLARAIPARFRGWTGILRGDAIEATYRRALGDRTLGQTAIPFAAVVWNIDHNRVEHVSTRLTPMMSVARAARTAISIPLMVQPVRMGGAWYGDGGVIDIFPIAPLAAEEPIDVVLGTNSYLPARFDGEAIGNWFDRSWAILRASGQLRYGVYLELAREHVRQLGDRLELLHPVPHAEVRGAKFYESFLDRSSWPHYMRLGHAHARDALERLDARFRRQARSHVQVHPAIGPW